MKKAAKKRSPNDWHGWCLTRDEVTPRDGKMLGIGRIPGRLSFGLYRLDGSVFEVLAYFRSEKLARVALKRIDELVFRLPV